MTMIKLRETPIPTRGKESDIRIILAIATSYMRRLGMSCEEQQKLRDKVHNANSVEEACYIIKGYFPLRPDPTRQKPKLKFTRISSNIGKY